jgi:hypothetical protein
VIKGLTDMSIDRLDAEWLEKPWMYSKPKNSQLLRKWRETWNDYVLAYAQQKNINLVNIIDLKREDPFRRMDQEAFEDIVQALAEQGYGKWWDKKKKLLRIYWRTLDQWANHIFEVAKKSGRSVIIGNEGFIELEPSLVTMPKEDLEQVFVIMVRMGLARWIDKKKKAIRII